MKQFLFSILLLLSISLNAQIDKAIPPRPVPARLVNDFTSTLSPEQRDELERKLVQYDDTTSNQIAVVIINSLADYKDYPLEEFSLGILRNWGVGNKKNNNGIVLLVVKNDRKVRIETGYGLEGAVPDITAKAIIENEILPAFRQNNYYRGLDNGTSAIMRAAAGEYKAPKGYNQGNKVKGIGLGSLFIFVIILFILFASRGGGSGGGGGGYASRRGYRDFGTGWILGSLLGGGGSGWSGGGGGGGWSGGGGGFGGFGGGSGGGGGASGSW